MSDSTWRHPVRQRLEAGQPVFGITITTPGVEAAAHAATLGFHFLWVEMEHSPVTLETLRLMVLATRGLPAAVFARVPVVETWTAKRVLDQGVSGVIFPFAGTPEKAATAAAACRYPPAGKRGSGAGAAVRTWPQPGNYYDSADANIVAVCVVEEASALDHIDAIAATPGVDVLFIGPGDLSYALGCPGRLDDPRYRDALTAVLAAAANSGISAGILVPNAAEARRHLELGFRFIAVGSDGAFVMNSARSIVSDFRAAAG